MARPAVRKVRPRRRGALRVPCQHGAQSRSQESKGTVAAPRVGDRGSHASNDRLPLARSRAPDAARLVGTGSARSDREERFQRIRHLVITRGRYFDDDELSSSAKLCLLTEELAAAMFPGSDPVGAVAHVGELRLIVIGVFRERVSTFGASEVQRESALVPFHLMRY